MIRWVAIIVGVVLALLGGLWLVQGLGLIHLEPVACVGACETIQGSSPTWAVIGGATLAAGVLAIVFGLRRRAGPGQDRR